ncbi:MAG: tripartite tricarboxylate transporter substrate binding protein [Burkholderiales bacterium]|nr:tripartite tricarboxylate transporter substrate binding protein [Burkholderiales bacterium]
MIRTLLAFALAAVLGLPVFAQTYPSKPVRLIVPYSTGSATDALARLIAQRLSESLRQQVVVDNQPGANGIPASAAVAKAPPDGHMLIMIAANHVVNASLYSKLPFDTLKDFTPVVRVAFAPFILTVHPSLPVKNLKELIAFAKSRPGQLNYGSPSNGSPAHLATELLKTMTGIDLVHVPYKAAAQAQADLLGGQIPVMFVVASAAIPQVAAGRLRALGITTAKRIQAAADIPTVDEAGVKGFELISWIGLAGPAGMPADIVNRLGAEVTKIVQAPENRERIQRLGLEISLMPGAEFAAYMGKEQARLGEVVRKAGARLD